MSKTVSTYGQIKWSGRHVSAEERKAEGGGIHCPTCGSASTEVYNTRPWDGGQIRRYRKCLCGARFITTERVGT